MATRRPTGPTRTTQPPKPATEKPVPRPGAASLTPAPATAGKSSRITISEDARRRMIAEAAYLRAERRGFTSGKEEEDWLAAEAEVDALLEAGHGRPPQ